MLDADRVKALKAKYLEKSHEPESLVDCRLINGDKAVRNDIGNGRYAYYNPKAGGAYAIGERIETPEIGKGSLEHIQREIFKANLDGRIPDLTTLENEARREEPWSLDEKFDYLLDVLHMARVNDSDGVAIGEENPEYSENGRPNDGEPIFHPYPEFVASVGYRSEADFLHLIKLAEAKGYVKTDAPIDADGVWAALTIEGNKKRKEPEKSPASAQTSYTEPLNPTKTNTFIDRFREHPVIVAIGILAAIVIGALTIANGGLDFLIKTRALENGNGAKARTDNSITTEIISERQITLHSASSFQDDIIVADKITVAGVVNLPGDVVLISNELRFAENSKLIYPNDARPLLIAALKIIGGVIESNGPKGEAQENQPGGDGQNGGALTVLTRASSSLVFNAVGGDGAPGAQGLKGTNGRNGKCGAGGYKGAQRGGQGNPGKNGGDGGNGGAFLALTNEPSTTLTAKLSGGKAARGGSGGPGGDGGAGCTGLGGSQPNEPDGDPGDNGADGSPGADGTSLIVPLSDFELRFAKLNAEVENSNGQRTDIINQIFAP